MYAVNATLIEFNFLAAESQKYDQLTLWRKYQKLKAQEEERFCSLDNGKIKVQFYHQSYNQVFKMRIINARGLKCHVPNRALNTRVKILLITPLKTRNIPRQTRVIEQSNDPDFDQVLEINLTRKTTRDSTVEVSIWSIDDFYKESLIGGFVIDLKKYDVAQRNTVEEEIKIEFEVSLGRQAHIFEFFRYLTIEKLNPRLKYSRSFKCECLLDIPGCKGSARILKMQLQSMLAFILTFTCMPLRRSMKIQDT